MTRSKVLAQYTGWAKSMPTTKLSWNRIKSYYSLPMRLDSFVELKY